MSKENTIFVVEGMSCSHCEKTIKTAVENLNGICNVMIDLKGKKVAVEFDDEKIEMSTIKAVIEDQGYEVK